MVISPQVILHIAVDVADAPTLAAVIKCLLARSELDPACEVVHGYTPLCLALATIGTAAPLVCRMMLIIFFIQFFL
jgi:hypothetical protein